MMTTYISVSFSKRKLLEKELTAIIEILNEHKIAANIFVDNYKFDSTQEKQMMQQAMNDIDHCDILIAEVSEKGIGVGIEVGYAKAKGKTIIYLRKKDAEHSTTISGVSDLQIVYCDINHLREQLALALKEIITTH